MKAGSWGDSGRQGAEVWVDEAGAAGRRRPRTQGWRALLGPRLEKSDPKSVLQLTAARRRKTKPTKQTPTIQKPNNQNQNKPLAASNTFQGEKKEKVFPWSARSSRYFLRDRSVFTGSRCVGKQKFAECFPFSLYQR